MFDLQVVEEPYTMREARIHVRHVRDLLKSIDYTDAYAGQECSSLAFLTMVTQGDILGEILVLYVPLIIRLYFDKLRSNR